MFFKGIFLLWTNTFAQEDQEYQFELVKLMLEQSDQQPLVSNQARQLSGNGEDLENLELVNLILNEEQNYIPNQARQLSGTGDDLENLELVNLILNEEQNNVQNQARKLGSYERNRSNKRNTDRPIRTRLTRTRRSTSTVSNL